MGHRPTQHACSVSTSVSFLSSLPLLLLLFSPFIFLLFLKHSSHRLHLAFLLVLIKISLVLSTSSSSLLRNSVPVCKYLNIHPSLRILVS